MRRGEVGVETIGSIAKRAAKICARGDKQKRHIPGELYEQAKASFGETEASLAFVNAFAMRAGLARSHYKHDIVSRLKNRIYDFQSKDITRQTIRTILREAGAVGYVEKRPFEERISMLAEVKG